MGTSTTWPGMFFLALVDPTGGDWISGVSAETVETPAPVNPSYTQRDGNGGGRQCTSATIGHCRLEPPVCTRFPHDHRAASRRATCVLPAIIWAIRERCGSCESCGSAKTKAFCAFVTIAGDGDGSTAALEYRRRTKQTPQPSPIHPPPNSPPNDEIVWPKRQTRTGIIVVFISVRTRRPFLQTTNLGTNDLCSLDTPTTPTDPRQCAGPLVYLL